MRKIEINDILTHLSIGGSSSFHILNADAELPLPLKIIFRILNQMNNSFPNNKLDKYLEIKNLNIDKNDLKSLLSKMQTIFSPARKLSDLFWFNLPWNKIKDELKEINILEIGCSNGLYVEKFMEFSKNNINSYTGLDIWESENWKLIKKKYKNVDFIVYDGKNIPNLPNINFIVSQSVLEHVKQDLTLFREINRFISSKNIIQCHLFPSKSCYDLFRFHGIRQYTPRTISKITKLFNKSYKILFNLGGEKCNLIHTTFISTPKRNKQIELRHTNTKLYEKILFHSIKKDLEKTQKNPNFYALLIHSNYKNRII